VESGALPSEWPVTPTRLCGGLFRQLAIDLPNRWWRHPCARPAAEQEPGWASPQEHWLAWSTISEMGPRRSDPRESCPLTNPDWGASELIGKGEEADI